MEIKEKRIRGRQPIGDKAMTNAEKQQRYRDKKKALNTQEIFLSLSGQIVEDLNVIADQLELSRTKVVGDLLRPIVRDLMPILLEDSKALDEKLKQQQLSSEASTRLKTEYWETLIKKIQE